MKSACHNSPVKHYSNGCYCPVCFKPQKNSNNYTWVAFPLALLLLMGMANTVKAPDAGKLVIMNIIHKAYENDIVPSDSTVLEELVKHHCVLPSVAVAQARIESANYTSDIARGNKNLFGIKAHKCKYLTGERKGHATFATYKDNIACYCHIQERYLNKIHKSYAEDSLYIRKVKQMK